MNVFAYSLFLRPRSGPGLLTPFSGEQGPGIREPIYQAVVNLHHPTRHESGSALSISAGRDRFVGPGPVRASLREYAAAASRNSRPSDEEVRAALSVATAIGELYVERAARGGERIGPEDPWKAAILEDRSELAARCAIYPAQVEKGLELLQSAGVVQRIGPPEARRLRVPDDFVAELPALAHLAWQDVRDRLPRRGRAAALSVLRELALLTPASTPAEGWPWVVADAEQLQETTYLSRSQVYGGLLSLRECDVLQSEPHGPRVRISSVQPDRARSSGGAQDSPGPSSLPSPTATSAQPAAEMPAHPLSKTAGTSPAAASARAPTFLVGGVQISLEPGMGLQVTQGPDGALHITITPRQ